MSSNGNGVFPAFGGRVEKRKAAGFQRLLRIPGSAGALGSEPPRAVPVRTAVPLVTIPVNATVPAAVEAPVHAALEAVVAPAFGAEAAVLHMGQHGQTALLAIVQRLVE